MGLRSRKLLTPDKWYRVNEIVRANDDLKNALNAAPIIQTAFESMLTIVKGITAELGLPTDYQGVPAEYKETAFPIPKMFWMGVLPLDTYIDDPENPDRKKPEHRKAFAAQASALRKAANVIIASWRLNSDAYNKGDEGNPGGQVDT